MWDSDPMGDPLQFSCEKLVRAVTEHKLVGGPKHPKNEIGAPPRGVQKYGGNNPLCLTAGCHHTDDDKGNLFYYYKGTGQSPFVPTLAPSLAPILFSTQDH